MKRIIFIFLVTLLLLCGCTSQKNVSDLKVLAAASLTESLERVDEIYNATKCQYSFDSTTRLRIQVEEGLNADVFFLANKENYEKLLNGDYVEEGKEIFKNNMVIIVNINNDNITSIEDLEKEYKLILADKEVPAGKYARKIIENLAQSLNNENIKDKIISNLVSNESNVKGVVSKVALGEGDVGIVYRTDVTNDIKDKVRVIEIPEDINVIASYYACVLKNSENINTAKEFYDFLDSENVKNIFSEHGFIVE